MLPCASILPRAFFPASFLLNSQHFRYDAPFAAVTRYTEPHLLALTYLRPRKPAVGSNVGSLPLKTCSRPPAPACLSNLRLVRRLYGMACCKAVRC